MINVYQKKHIKDKINLFYTFSKNTMFFNTSVFQQSLTIIPKLSSSVKRLLKREWINNN